MTREKAALILHPDTSQLASTDYPDYDAFHLAVIEACVMGAEALRKLDLMKGEEPPWKPS